MGTGQWNNEPKGAPIPIQCSFPLCSPSYLSHSCPGSSEGRREGRMNLVPRLDHLQSIHPSAGPNHSSWLFGLAPLCCPLAPVASVPTHPIITPSSTSIPAAVPAQKVRPRSVTACKHLVRRLPLSRIRGAECLQLCLQLCVRDTSSFHS